MTENFSIERSQIQALRAKAESLTRWLSEHASYCQTSQKHLDRATVEQAYWHYGYVCAIQDILAIVDPESTP